MNVLCAQVQLDLPWYVNGTLMGEARDALEAHLPQCGSCRSRLQEEQYLFATMRDVDTKVVSLPQSAWMEFEQRLAGVGAGGGGGRPGDAAIAPSPPPRVRPARFRRRLSRRALTLAVGAQAAALLLLAGFLWFAAPPVNTYRVLTNPQPTVAAGSIVVRVVVAPGVTMAETRSLAHRFGMSVLDGPGARNIYTFALPPDAPAGGAGDPAAMLTTMRAEPGVLFAELVSDDVGAGLPRGVESPP